MAQMTNPGGAAQPAPGPISTPDLWDLNASPASLEELAGAWRSLREAASSAQDTVDQAAYRVFADEAWQGDTADTYDGHRRRLTGDVGELAERAGPVVDALEYLAGVLETNQELLHQERARLAEVPVTESGAGLIFRPNDEDQARAVNQAITAAHEIRSRVDEALAAKREDFQSAHTDLGQLSDTWRPRTVRMLNLNIGQGHGNVPLDSSGTDTGEMDEIAQIIADENADIVTLQEVFQRDLGTLESDLEERTGAEWEVRFEEASRKVQWDDGWFGNDHFNEPFGNAVLVRRGDVIGDVAESDRIKLDVEGSEVEPGIEDGEGRAATEVEVRLNPRR